MRQHRTCLRGWFGGDTRSLGKLCGRAAALESAECAGETADLSQRAGSPADAARPRGRARHVGESWPLAILPVLHYKFVLLGHNTIRGAAGGSILNAELCVSKGYIRG